MPLSLNQWSTTLSSSLSFYTTARNPSYILSHCSCKNCFLCPSQTPEIVNLPVYSLHHNYPIPFHCCETETHAHKGVKEPIHSPPFIRDGVLPASGWVILFQNASLECSLGPFLTPSTSSGKVRIDSERHIGTRVLLLGSVFHKNTYMGMRGAGTERGRSWTVIQLQ